MDKALILRVGGLGDILTLTPIAKKLSEKYDVDFFAGSPTGPVYKLLTGLSFIKNVKEITRVNGIDCAKDENEHWISVEILKDEYTEVFDYKYSIEDNRSGLNKDEGWRHTINSNYVNWIDHFFAWANIDPSKVPLPEKAPLAILPSNDYTKWAQETPVGIRDRRNYKVIGIQLQASSLMRTWYKAGQLPNLIHDKYKDDVVCIFAQNKWIAITRNGNFPIQFPDKLDPLICSVALIAQMDAFIGADTGMSHVAEIFGTPHITIYTTVPSWTRSKYYRYELPLDATVDCHPCFTLDLFCPLEKKKAFDSLTQREKDIIESSRKNEDIGIVATRYSTVPRGIMNEFEAAQKRVEGLSATEPACVKSITPELIISSLESILNSSWKNNWENK